MVEIAAAFAVLQAIALGMRWLLELVAGADVLVESFTPGTLDALALGRDVLARINPRLVHVAITAFGSDGPKASWPATDLTIAAASYAMSLNGDRDRPPVRVGVAQAYNFAAAAGAAAAGAGASAAWAPCDTVSVAIATVPARTSARQREVR